MSETYKSVIVIDKENRSEILDQDTSSGWIPMETLQVVCYVIISVHFQEGFLCVPLIIKTQSFFCLLLIKFGSSTRPIISLK